MSETSEDSLAEDAEGSWVSAVFEDGPAEEAENGWVSAELADFAFDTVDS